MNKTLTILLLCGYVSTQAKVTDLDKYKKLLEGGTYESQNWKSFKVLPKSRYYTFKKAFEHFERTGGKIVVELGTTRSFVHGGHPGCNSDNSSFWTPNEPKNWDWGAGFFTRMACESLAHLNPVIHTVDLEARHIRRCQIITEDFRDILHYHVTDSVSFLKKCDFKIDLLYLDTGNITPINLTALLQLHEAQTIVERDIIAPNGIILIDDVRNQTPKKFGEESDLGKAKFSVPYLLKHGFEIVEDEYQIIMRKTT